MKTNNLINLFRLYWIENKNMLILFSLTIFLFNLVIESWFFFELRHHEILLMSKVGLFAGMIFLFYQRKSIAISTTLYNNIILSVRAIDKWIVSFFINIIVAFSISLLFSFLGQFMGVYLLQLLRGSIIHININFSFDLFEMAILFWAQSALAFLFLAMLSAKSLSVFTVKNWKIIAIILLSYFILIQSVSFEFMRPQVMRVLLDFIVGIVFWIANYFIIKNKQLK